MRPPPAASPAYAPPPPPPLQATIGADFLTKEVSVDDRLVTMQVCIPPPLPLSPAQVCPQVWRGEGAISQLDTAGGSGQFRRHAALSDMLDGSMLALAERSGRGVGRRR